MSRGKRSKDTEVAELTLELASLRNQAETEDWWGSQPMLCHVTPWHALPCHATPRYTMPSHAKPCHTMPCDAMPCHRTVEQASQPLARYQLSGVTPIGEWGALRLRTRFLHDLIMPQVPRHASSWHDDIMPGAGVVREEMN